MKKVGLFGGTFDPIHNGHMSIAYEALYRLCLHEVIFIPAGNPPHKSRNLITESGIRYDMVKAAVKDESKFTVSDYEIKKESRSYTYETIEYFKKSTSDLQLHLIIGEDSFFDIEKWANAQYILRNCTVVVFGRNEINYIKMSEHRKHIMDKYNSNILLLETPILEISSTLIREKLNKNENISYLVPCGVEEFIRKSQLYKQNYNL
ncbi:nicotinate-nucleotide adenylyltransferase [Hathewaya proteolytica DSM 3090]|uniref:Probable nicotinate-nucleotide adenylyltransferase n=1 Tax=Hathewaya proteolytica DSM 3090 TaxID=1121331 RepID=A0A1M6JJ63_9CLOT|nr:nicotinate-nucleotide adenylyltransferase [Hathewaya proteolytica]SHJ46652.1 nicotinate-nucleotide adenylyltransferase [Hathewaya proteolytica DSM 3090]